MQHICVRCMSTRGVDGRPDERGINVAASSAVMHIRGVMASAPGITCELSLISLPPPQQFRGSHDAVEFFEIIHAVAERRIGSVLLEARIVVTRGAGQRSDNAA